MSEVSPAIGSEFVLRRVVTVLPRYRYRFFSEKQLHDGISQVLHNAKIPFVYEHIASATDRFDFFCQESVVIEAKIGGTLPQALRQVDRYCELAEVKGVVIAGTKAWAAGYASALELRGKPVRIVHIQPQAF